jgi:hypothetical protein
MQRCNHEIKWTRNTRTGASLNFADLQMPIGITTNKVQQVTEKCLINDWLATVVREVKYYIE